MQMKDRNVLLTAINAKYIHSNLAVYSLKANAGPYAGRVGIAEYTINHRREEILQGIYFLFVEVVPHFPFDRTWHLKVNICMHYAFFLYLV